MPSIQAPYDTRHTVTPLSSDAGPLSPGALAKQGERSNSRNRGHFLLCRLFPNERNSARRSRGQGAVCVFFFDHCLPSVAGGEETRRCFTTNMTRELRVSSGQQKRVEEKYKHCFNRFTLFLKGTLLQSQLVPATSRIYCPSSISISTKLITCEVWEAL